MGRHVSLLTVFVPCFKDVILLFWITLQEVKMRELVLNVPSNISAFVNFFIIMSSGPINI